MTTISLGATIAAALTYVVVGVLGLQYQVLLVGLLGGLIALSFAQPTSRRRMAALVISSALLSGYATPVLAEVLFDRVPELAHVRSATVLLLALLLGLTAQVTIPALL